MTHDLQNCTFLIPFMNQDSDREFNIKNVLNYLNKNFKTNIIVVEQKCKDTNIDKSLLNNLSIEHILHTSHHKNIHKTKLYNIGLAKIKTKITVTYDSDILLPVEQLLNSVQFVDNLYDYSYPFNSSCIEISKKLPEQREKLLQDYKFNEYIDYIFNVKNKIPFTISKTVPAGGCMVLKTKSYILAGMENENFVGYSQEDAERRHRLNVLGFTNHNSNGYIFHIEHTPALGGRVVSRDNQKLFRDIENMNKQTLQKYYQQLNYKGKYGVQ